MTKIEITKIHLLVKRKELIEQLNKEGYNGSEIGQIFNIDRSSISRILKVQVLKEFN